MSQCILEKCTTPELCNDLSACDAKLLRDDPPPVRNVVPWHSINTDNPPEDTLLMVAGPSGESIHKKFLALAYYDEAYRPRRGGWYRWLDVNSFELSNCGWHPTHWAYPIELPEVE
jgi:hypothetical protein